MDVGRAAVWWSQSEHSAITASGYNIIQNSDGIYRGTFNKTTGLSIRAVYCPSCSNDTTKALTLSDKLQNVLDSSLESSTGVGISAAVIMSDGETWLGTSGISHGTVEIIPDMRFAAGSIGKMFTAAVILQLAEENSLALDDSLCKWLPSYSNIDSTITIRQLLNHTSGISDFADNPDYWDAIFTDPSKVWTPEQIIITFNSQPLYPKGTGWNYTTTGYNLLRMIIMKITNSDLVVAYNERLWLPLGLNQTFTLLDEELPNDIAHGWYDLDDDNVYDDFYSWPRTAFVTGIGGEIWTTAEDLAKWSKALFYEKKVISQNLLDQMLTFHSPCTGEEFVCAGYGLGTLMFNPQMVNGVLAYGHGGNAPGYAAICLYLPDYQVCIGIMDNTEAGEVIGSCTHKLIEVITSYFENHIK
jgi:D-alanyl-D-alanine carboxypeptidase